MMQADDLRYTIDIDIDSVAWQWDHKISFKCPLEKSSKKTKLVKKSSPWQHVLVVYIIFCIYNSRLPIHRWLFNDVYKEKRKRKTKTALNVYKVCY